MERLNRIISSKKIIIPFFLLITIVIGTHQLIINKKARDQNGHVYTYYNNYVIFRQSFYHLAENKDPYQLYPEEHADYYKYSPAFSLFFGIFAIFPDYIGLNLWNILNTLVLLLAVYYLPHIDNRKKGLILLACLLELVTSLQNSQSNGLVAGLMIFSLGFLERGKNFWSAFVIVFWVFIKLFGIVGFALFLLYPQKWKSALYSFLWILVLGFIPLIVVSSDQLTTIYQSWWHLLRMDQSASYGLSLAGLLHAWTGTEIPKLPVLMTGAVLFFVPFLLTDKFKDYTFRLFLLSEVLIWVIIFNHKAESPGYIIAFAGISIWYVLSEKSYLNTALFIFAFVVTCLSPTDLFPRSLRNGFFEPYMLKALPVILVWMKILFDLVFFDRKSTYFCRNS